VFDILYLVQIFNGLNQHNTWCSDDDPNTHLMYIVRKRGYEYLKIPPFE